MTGGRSIYNSPKPYGGRYKVSQILGLGAEVRLLNPKLQQTKGESPRWYIRPQVERPGPDGTVIKATERIYIEAAGKREAMVERGKILAKLNRREYALAAQMEFGELLDEYLRRHVNREGVLKASTRAKYKCHIENHLRPGLGEMPIGLITSARLEAWMDSKRSLSCSTLLDLRNLLMGIFTKAEEWEYLRDRRNPASSLKVGRHELARPRRKLTVDETRALLELLPADIRLICQVALSCVLRISEVFGIQEQDVDQVSGRVCIRRRYWRGDVDSTKTSGSARVCMLGLLLPAVLPLLTGDPERYVFSAQTKTTRKLKSGEIREGYVGRVCRDDRSMNRYFLRPAAKALGVYYEGFGFHAMRVEGVTEYSSELSPYQLRRLAGHTTDGMTAHYTLADVHVLDRAARAVQERVLGLKKEAAKQPQVATEGGEERVVNG